MVMMLIDVLHESVSAVAPINGISIGNPSDKSSWRIDWAEGATDEQKAAVAALVAAFDPSAPSMDSVNDERDRRMSVLPFGGHVYQFDSESQTNIAGVGVLALGALVSGADVGNLRWADPKEDFFFITAHNEAIPMDAQTTWAFAQSAARWKALHIYAARAIKDMIPIPADFSADSYWPRAAS